MIRSAIVVLLVTSPLAAIPAVAAPSNDARARNAIEVRTLENFTRVAPSDGGAFVELAQAYLRDNRVTEAAAAYRRALAVDDVMLETPTGAPVWSHQIARAALTRIPQLSVR